MIANDLTSRGHSGGPIDILLAGASDTGLLATAALGATAAGPKVASRVRYTVIDRCQTPLELCRAYATHANLDLTVSDVDLTRDANGFSADLICLHSVFRFLPPDAHVKALRQLAGWLKPGGRILFSQRLTMDGPLYRADVMKKKSERIETMVRANPDTISEPLDEFLARLKRMPPRALAQMEFSTPDELHRLFAAAAVDVVEERFVDRRREGKISHRILALLAPQSAGQA